MDKRYLMKNGLNVGSPSWNERMRLSNNKRREAMTFAKVRETFDYSPVSGELFWRVRKKGSKGLGNLAGYTAPDGYCYVVVDGIRYMLHTLVYLWCEGYYPESFIDHIDRNPSNNRIENLRPVNQQCNLRNASPRTDNTSGVKGVSWDKRCEKWRAEMFIGGKYVYLGRYTTKIEAVAHRLAAEQCLNWGPKEVGSTAFVFMSIYLSSYKELS